MYMYGFDIGGLSDSPRQGGCRVDDQRPYGRTAAASLRSDLNYGACRHPAVCAVIAQKNLPSVFGHCGGLRALYNVLLLMWFGCVSV